MVYAIDEIKTIIIPIAGKYRLKAVYLFGSYARGTATDASDIDLLIDTSGTDLDTLFKLGALYNELSQAFCKEIDLITVSSIEQPAIRESEIAFRENILKERMNLYAVA
ncbi:MAG: nucleotidyltransferase domain-containing protein [Schwartzia sp.]|nr:nucleotidyltransferase domain-containing protein [Clostridia bacterium]MBQ9633733.1 nucleotidyltransferase domain-containing protein [Schwartzia sp. (in: firmicutes)]MBR0508652.1 nucleotidyltransferase domain-containing protein [Clostridia bacterium]MBR0538384.1 nucleotidyltransferase domain-containing protein [Clostridia bacterium]